MAINAVTISSGHGLKIRGSKDIIDEVDEARKVVNLVADYIEMLGVKVNVIHDNVSTTQSANITSGKSSYIVSEHNATYRDLDVSVHFNASSHTNDPRGTEVFAFFETSTASKVSKAIADASGLKDRGGKLNPNLVFLNSTDKDAILIEVCFVDSVADVELYRKNFDKICRAIAESITGKKFPNTDNEGESKMYKPSNNAFVNSTAIVLKRLEAKENGISSVHREKLLKGELSESDATAILYVAIERGLIQGTGTPTK